MKLLTFLAIFCVILTGCASSLPRIPDVPDVEIQEVTKEVPCVVTITPVGKSVLPEYPPFDMSDPKGWAIEVRETTKKREALKDEENTALRRQIEHHNSLEPKCSGDG